MARRKSNAPQGVKTVGDLRKAIKDLPDSTPLVGRDGNGNEASIFRIDICAWRDQAGYLNDIARKELTGDSPGGLFERLQRPVAVVDLE